MYKVSLTIINLNKLIILMEKNEKNIKSIFEKKKKKCGLKI